MNVDINLREQRLRNGLCPHCGKKNSNSTLAPPLTMGIVERGQECLRCVDGIKSESKGVAHYPTVKATPVSFAPHPTFVEMPPQFSELKQSPERLFAASAKSADYLWKNDEFDDISRDEESLEDYPLLDMNLCRLDGYHNSLLSVNDMDDRKPPAKSLPQSEQALPTREDTDLIDVMIDSTQSRGDSSSSTTYEEGSIDPSFLASLPENLRQEVLNQATTLKTQPKDTRRSSTMRTRQHDATNFTLSTNHNLSDSFLAALPDDIREEVIAEYANNREKQSNSNIPVSATSACLSSTLTDIEIDEGTNEFNASNYDPEMLASLPEELRIEILKDELKQREQQRLNNVEKAASKVGAVSVDIPAGYDPETFTALPEYMQNKLRDDASRQGATCASSHNAPLVLAQPIGFEEASNATSCTYEGEYNNYGKRHGNGELRWANGDRYVGQFTDGFIEGRGTLSFHDGK